MATHGKRTLRAWSKLSGVKLSSRCYLYRCRSRSPQVIDWVAESSAATEGKSTTNPQPHWSVKGVRWTIVVPVISSTKMTSLRKLHIVSISKMNHHHWIIMRNVGFFTEDGQTAASTRVYGIHSLILSSAAHSSNRLCSKRRKYEWLCTWPAEAVTGTLPNANAGVWPECAWNTGSRFR